MSLGQILDNLTIKPLEYIFEFIFSLVNYIVASPGFSLICLSIVVNLLLLPLFRRTDKIQDEERQLQAKMQDGVEHIRRTFKGDERFMLLQTYYRQNNYKPYYALRGLLPLFLEIPFFIAAYRFISGMTLLNGIPFGPIQNLGMPDQSLSIFSISVNVLPILMTLINILSGLIYTKGAPFKAKAQLYGMAIIFLLLLYNSPSALVIYWTMNNLFSLIKNLVVSMFLNKTSKKPDNIKSKTVINPLYFFVGALIMSLLVGLLIPSSVLKASPEEFILLHSKNSPLFYLLHSTSIAIGLFVIWGGIFYLIQKPQKKTIFAAAIWLGIGLSLLNYMGFARSLGTLSPDLKYEASFAFMPKEIIINVIAVVLLGIILILIFKRFKTLIPIAYFAVLVAILVMSVNNLTETQKVLASDHIKQEEQMPFPSINLSKDEPNVIVLMLDRAIGEYVPYIMQEKPILEEKFSGFTYYPNTLAFGKHTNVGAPAIYGGYAYTPWAMNQRPDKSIASKHDEALKIMPYNFGEAGYQVTLLDPPYAGYRVTPNLGIFDNMKNVDAYISKGYFTYQWPELDHITERKWERNFFWHGMMKSSPLLVQPIIYNGGNYNAWPTAISSTAVKGDNYKHLRSSVGYHTTFLNNYLVLDNLQQMTTIEKNGKGHVLLMANEVTHESTLLQKPDYTPQYVVDNSMYDKQLPIQKTVDEKSIVFDTSNKIKHYHVNMASFLKLGEWFDYLKTEGVYDNTKIILVSDHSYSLELHEDSIVEGDTDIGAYNALLMVKDFNQQIYSTDETFMTVADVPELAMRGLIDEMKDPFTGQAISSQKYKAENQIVTGTGIWSTNENNGNTWKPDIWFEIENNNLHNPANWKFLGKH